MAIPSETAERLIALTIFWMVTQEADIRMWILDEARKRGETFKREFMVDRSLDGCRLLPFPSVPWTTLPPRLALRWATEPKVRWALHRLGLIAGVVAAASTACRPVASAAFLALAAAEIYCVFASYASAGWWRLGHFLAVEGFEVHAGTFGKAFRHFLEVFQAGCPYRAGNARLLRESDAALGRAYVAATVLEAALLPLVCASELAVLALPGGAALRGSQMALRRCAAAAVAGFHLSNVLLLGIWFGTQNLTVACVLCFYGEAPDAAPRPAAHAAGLAVALFAAAAAVARADRWRLALTAPAIVPEFALVSKHVCDMPVRDDVRRVNPCLNLLAAELPVFPAACRRRGADVFWGGRKRERDKGIDGLGHFGRAIAEAIAARRGERLPPRFFGESASVFGVYPSRASATRRASATARRRSTATSEAR
ncbi:phosphoglycerate mutase [Aureococcus anophagefferens]|nr:phosphoglycerate mutase [Aureococcus anophagefferens]